MKDFSFIYVPLTSFLTFRSRQTVRLDIDISTIQITKKHRSKSLVLDLFYINQNNIVGRVNLSISFMNFK